MTESTQTPQAPRIAIKFGTSASNSSKSSSGTRKPGQSLPPSALGKRPRSHALNNDSDSEEDDNHYGRHEKVTTIGGKDDANSRQRDTKSARTDSRPLVIACQTEGSWKAEARRKQERPTGQNRETEPADHEKQIKWGLSITKKSAAAEESTETTQEDHSDDTAPATAAPAAKTSDSAPKTMEQSAMDALLGIDTEKQKKLVISGSEAPTDEFKAAVQAAGEVSTIEEYDQIPDGEFGMAMLRGMGYNESKESSRPKEVRRRPALLGLGAKEDEEIKKAELAKKHGHRDRRPRLDEYRRGENEKRQQREEKYSSSYKHERDRERSGYGSSRRNDDRERPRERYRDREGESSRHRDRHSRR